MTLLLSPVSVRRNRDAGIYDNVRDAGIYDNVKDFEGNIKRCSLKRCSERSCLDKVKMKIDEDRC